ncbi:MAG: serine/threonine-protein phosphatase [Deltaproteobacteria bacterium]|jgi:serine phosphatase RsbU (regulator of sigma subunit)|nr:serine/threonine-protein phosphatase [Deltaproteobacteria bacterium]MBW2475813.1 serine/threonine-protein phosphatase [Deltaproteobacteria bacterium]MBW2504052.1 serine/threonine-protein phosphatase [Deltaproteobacteria bacterium]
MKEVQGSPEPGPVSLRAGEINLAGEVQRLLLPKSSPACTWCCMGVNNRMARVLGGDFYDFIGMPDDCQVLFLGDVTGHGLHASVVMSLVYGFLHRAVMEGCNPQRAMGDLNSFLRSFAARSDQLDYFFSATLFYGVIDPQRLRMHYINAGHPAGLVRRGEELLRLKATSHPIGYFDQPDFQIRAFDFQIGDRLFLYTDGVVDAMNSAGEMYGIERLESNLAHSNDDHQAFLDQLFDQIRQFMGKEPLRDDCTGIVVDFHRPF